jgi:hypothetical protein
LEDIPDNVKRKIEFVLAEHMDTVFAATRLCKCRNQEGRKMEIKNAEFLASFASYDINLEPSLPEIALIGKSNVGGNLLLTTI